MVSDEQGIVPVAPDDGVIATSTAHSLVGGAVAEDRVGSRATVDRVVAAVAGHDGHEGTSVVAEDRVGPPRTTLDRVVPAIA